MSPRHSIRRIPLHLTMTALLLGTPAILHAQEDRPEEEEQQTDEQILEDFGSGLRAFGALLDDADLDVDELKELYAAAEDALNPDQDMVLYLDNFEANQQQIELEEFRDELKSSVMNGAMSRGEALSAWLEVMDVRFFHDFKKDEGTVWAERLEESEGLGHLSSIMLRIPGAGDVRVLTRPEFLPRDLQYFSRELELDEESRTVIKVLLEDYANSYETRSRALKEAIRATRGGIARRSALDRVARAESNLNDLVGSIDLIEIRNQIGDQFEIGDRQEWFYNAIDRFERSVAHVQNAIESRHRYLDHDVGTGPDSTQVRQMANKLQVDRRRMRTELIEGMRLALDDQQKQELELILDRVILAQARIDSKLGGSKMNLEEAVALAFEERAIDERTQTLLSDSTEEVLQLVNRWTNARINRELSGVELFVAYQQDDESSIEGHSRKHAQRARAELNAAIAIRDRLIAGQVELETVIAESDRDTATRFANIAREQGFASQMRTRWSERAISSALACTDLDQEERDTLKKYQSSLSSQLGPLRLQSIQERLIIEPKIARTKIDKLAGKIDRSELGLAGWQEPGFARFRSIDEQVNGQLESLLAEMPCKDALPRRRGARPVASP